MRKEITVKALKDLLDRCFNEGVAMSFLTKPDKTRFTLEEMRVITLDAYLMALSDVLDAIAGDPAKLQDFVSAAGSAVLVDPDDTPSIIRVPTGGINYRGPEKEM